MATTRSAKTGRWRGGIVAEAVGELQRIVGRQVEHLLQAQERHVAIRALSDQDRRLVVARHAGAQDLELRLRAGIESGLRLLQCRAGLVQRRRGDGTRRSLSTAS